MERKPIELRFDCADNFRVAMTEREDAEAAEAIYKLAPVDVAHKAAFALPLDDRAFRRARLGPAIEIQVEILDALRNDVRPLFGRERRINANLHRKPSSV